MRTSPSACANVRGMNIAANPVASVGSGRGATAAFFFFRGGDGGGVASVVESGEATAKLVCFGGPSGGVARAGPAEIIVAPGVCSKPLRDSTMRRGTDEGRHRAAISGLGSSRRLTDCGMSASPPRRTAWASTTKSTALASSANDRGPAGSAARMKNTRHPAQTIAAKYQRVPPIA